MNSSSRVLMICVDAMSLPFAQSHIDQLPTLKKLIERGVVTHPDSPGDSLSACVWPTFISGKDVGEHGQYFPFQWDAEHHTLRRLSDPAWRDRFVIEPFWYDFARQGVDCTVLDAGFVLNDRQAPCRQVSNWSYQSTGRADASDPALLAEIRRRFGHRPIGTEVPVPKKRALCQRIRDQQINALQKKTDAVLWLMHRYPWQFFLVGYHELHRAEHNLWPIEGDYASHADPDAMLDVFKAFDRQLQRILETVEDGHTTVALFALHGMAPNQAQDHFVGRILSRLNARYLAEKGVIAEAKPKPLNLMARLRKTVPYRLQFALAAMLGERIQDWVVGRSMVGGLDWPRTPSFAVSSGGEGFVRLNLKGREAKGYFDPASEELSHYLEWLEAALLDIRVIGTDEPLIERITHTRDLFPGAKDHLLPDLLLRWAPEAPVEHIYSDKIGEVHDRLATGRGGNHAGASFLIVSGPGGNGEAVHAVEHIKDLGEFARACLSLSGQGGKAAGARPRQLEPTE